MSYANGYTYRRSITVAHAKVPNTDQTDFPVLVSGTYSYLAHTTHGGLCTDANGFDIAFYADEAGTTPLYWEINSYNHETGAVVFWVKVSLTTASDTIFYIFYGNAAVSTFQSTASSAWNSGFLGVYHLGDGTTLGLSGSTSTPRNLTKVGTVNPDTGKISGCGVWGESDGNTLYAADDAVWDVTNAVTLSAWIKTSANSYRNILDRDLGEASRCFQFRMSDTGKLQPIIFVGGVPKVFASTASINNDAWRHVAFTYDGANVRLYIDGAEAAPSPIAQTGNIDAGNNTLCIGCYGASGGYQQVWSGSIDEPRFENVVRSADWIATEYNNQNDPSTFYAVGDQAEAGGGGGLVIPVAMHYQRMMRT